MSEFQASGEERKLEPAWAEFLAEVWDPAEFSALPALSYGDAFTIQA